jgi:choline dehydrogenase-like flavoprotein
MNQTIRRIAVSGSAAVALLGGAAAITLADSPTASAAELETAVNRATGAPVSLPDGRTVHVRGLDAASYSATSEQHSVVVLAAAKSDDDPAGISNGNTPAGGSGAALTNPNTPATGQQTGYNQQITTQAGGGTIAVGMVSILLLAVIVWVKVKHSGLKAVDATLGVLFGIALSGTFIGTMGSQMTNSLVGSLGTALGGLG